MLLFSNKIIETEEVNEVVVENRNGSTIKDGETSIETIYSKSGRDIYVKNDLISDLKKYCLERGIADSDYAAISYFVSPNEPKFIRNDDYFKFDLENFNGRRYLKPNSVNKGNSKEIAKLKSTIEKELVEKGWLSRPTENHKRHISNLFVQNSKEEKALKELFIKTIEFPEIYNFLRQVNTIDFLHFPSIYNYAKTINKEKGRYDIEELPQKERETISALIDNETKKMLEEEKEYWFEQILKKRPLVKFWLAFEHARTKEVELDETTREAILSFNQEGHETIHYENGILTITEIAEEELNDFFAHYNIVYNDVQVMQELAQASFKDRFTVKEYKYYSPAAEQQEIIKNKIAEYTEEKKQKKNKTENEAN